MRGIVKTLAAGAVFALMPTMAWAQATIAGSVRDASGAVLPGVTVEASSPDSIEKVRTRCTEGSGRYRIEELRPGTYSGTFTLPGFSPVRREEADRQRNRVIRLGRRAASRRRAGDDYGHRRDAGGRRHEHTPRDRARQRDHAKLSGPP